MCVTKTLHNPPSSGDALTYVPGLWLCFLQCTSARPNRASRCPMAAVGSVVQMCTDITTATGHLSHHRVKLPLLLPQILNDSRATVRSSGVIEGRHVLEGQLRFFHLLIPTNLADPSVGAHQIGEAGMRVQVSAGGVRCYAGAEVMPLLASALHRPVPTGTCAPE